MRRNIISIIMVFALLMSFASCRRFEGDYEFETKAYVVDSEGVTRTVETEDKDGGKLHYYINDHGEKVYVNSNQIVVDKVTPTESTTLSPEMQSYLDTFNDPDALENLIEEDSELPELEFGDDLIDDSNSTEVDVELGNDGKPAHSDATNNYAEIVKSQTFTLDFTVSTEMEGQSMTIPITVIRDGQNLYFGGKIPVENKGSMRFSFIIKDDGCYMVVPAMRAYMTISKEYIGEMIPADIPIDEIDADYKGSSEVKINGKTYICDTYEKDGTVTKQYFINDELKRIETVSGEDVVIMELNSISKTADKSKFNLPKNYMDLTTVIGGDFNLMGSLS